VVILNIPKFKGGPRECGAKNGRKLRMEMGFGLV